jgi:hypothetical protein
MTTLWQVPAAVVALLAWLTIPPTSLADAARREAVRRAAVPAPVAVLSNQNLPPDWVASPSSRPASAASEVAAAEESDVVDSPAAAPETVPEAGGASQASVATPAATDIAPAGDAVSADAAPAASGPGSAKAAVPAGDDEPSWRNQMSTLRAALAADQAKAASLQTRINGLQTDFINRDDPGQKSLLEQQLRQALTDLDKARAQVQTDTAAIQALRERARRAGVPAGWTR